MGGKLVWFAEDASPNTPNIIDGALRWRDNAPYRTKQYSN